MAYDPDDLRQRADRYEWLVQLISDEQAIRALLDLARDFREREAKIEAANQKAGSSIRSS
jgi:hypothetical protein